MATFVVNAFLDEDAGVWYVADSNVPGLVTEAETIDKLVAKLQIMIPELCELNRSNKDNHDGLTEVPIEIITHSYSKVRLVAA